MQTNLGKIGLMVAVALAAALTTAAYAQQPTAPLPAPLVQPAATTTNSALAIRPAGGDIGAVRMEIFEGPNRLVRYISNGSPGEQAMLNDLERSENEMAYLKDLQALRRQYVTSERTIEPMRRYVQEQLYGTSISTSWYNTQGAVIPTYGGPGGYVYPYAYPYNYGNGGGLVASLGGSQTSVTRNLGYGMGDQGAIETAMAPVIAQQAGSPDYQAAVIRNYNTAMGRIQRSDRLASALGFRRGPITEAGYEAAPVTVTLKNGDTIEGTKVAEDGDWYVIDTAHGQDRIRKSEVNRISRVTSNVQR